MSKFVTLLKEASIINDQIIFYELEIGKLKCKRDIERCERVILDLREYLQKRLSLLGEL